MKAPKFVISTDGKWVVVLGESPQCTPAFSSGISLSFGGRSPNKGYMYLSTLRDANGNYLVTPEMVMRKGQEEMEGKIIDGRIRITSKELKLIHNYPIEAARGVGPESGLVDTELKLVPLNDTKGYTGVQIINGVGKVGEYSAKIEDIIPDVLTAELFSEGQDRELVIGALGESFHAWGQGCVWQAAQKVEMHVEETWLEELRKIQM